MLYGDGRKARLLYELEVPRYPQEAQEELGVYETGDYAMQVRVSQPVLNFLLYVLECQGAIKQACTRFCWKVCDSNMQQNRTQSSLFVLHFDLRLCCNHGTVLKWSDLPFTPCTALHSNVMSASMHAYALHCQSIFCVAGRAAYQRGSSSHDFVFVR